MWGKLPSKEKSRKRKLANHVLPEGNPLNDIGASRKIFAVSPNGKLLSGERRRKMLSDAELTVNKR
jgi:hypothetical protein